MTKEEDFIKKGKCIFKHCSPSSDSAWCDLNSKNKMLKLHAKCPNPECNCQKIIAFTPNQYMLEGGSLKSKLEKIFKGTQTAWNKFPKPALKITSPYIGVPVSAKTENPKVGQATANIIKSISEGKILSLTDMHGSGLGLRVM